MWNSWVWAMTEWLHEGWNVIGGERCQAEACDATGVRCDYVDKRTRACRTTWCSQHWVAVAGKPYCRRHASVVAAMGADAGSDPVAALREVGRLLAFLKEPEPPKGFRDALERSHRLPKALRIGRRSGAGCARRLVGPLRPASATPFQIVHA